MVLSTPTPGDQSRQRILASRGAGGLRERLRLLSARGHADGATVRRSPPASSRTRRCPWPRTSRSRGTPPECFRCPTQALSSIGPHRRPAPSSSPGLTGKGRPLGTFGPPGTDTAGCVVAGWQARSREGCSVRRAGRPLDAGPCQRPAHASDIQQGRVLARCVVSRRRPHCLLGRPSRRHDLRQSRLRSRRRAGAVEGAGVAAFSDQLVARRSVPALSHRERYEHGI